MLSQNEYVKLTGLEIAKLVATKRYRAAEVVGAAIERLEQIDPALRAFTETWPRVAMAHADRLDADLDKGRPAPLLAGVPIAVKASEGQGSIQARRLIEAGCVVIGASSVPRPSTPWRTWGYTDRGPTCNPWRADLSPGGSSAGSAAAVAAGIVPIATANDGGGSIRLPAAWCGVIGLKPTTGVIQSINDPAGFNTGGPITRSVADAAAYVDSVAHTQLLSEVDPLRDNIPVRACWSATLGYADTQPYVEQIAEYAAGRLAEAELITWQDRTIRLHDPHSAWLMLRNPDADHNDAERIRVANNRRLAELFDEVDLLLTPTTPRAAHGHEGPGNEINVSLCWVFNLSGHPVITIPAGIATDGSPIGLQLVARHHNEAMLIRIAAAYEQISQLRRLDDGC